MVEKIGKTYETRLIELSSGLNLIRDSLKDIESGKKYSISTLSVQLRAFLCKNDSEVLLEYFSDLTGVSTDIYFYTKEFKCEIDLKSCMFLIPHFSIHQESDEQSTTTTGKILDLNIAFFDGYSFSIKRLIKEIADKLGGAHYDASVPIDFAGLIETSVFNSKPIELILASLGKIVYEIGVMMLSSIINSAYHFLFRFTSDTQCGYLFDFYSPTSPMKFSAFLNPKRKLNIKITSIDGTSFVCSSSKLLPLINDNYYIFAIFLDNDLKTNIRLYVNGEIFIETKTGDTLIVFNDPKQYERYFNRSQDPVENGCNAAIGLIAIYNITQNLGELSQAFQYFTKRKESPKAFYVFEDGAYGYIPYGASDIQLKSGGFIELVPTMPHYEG